MNSATALSVTLALTPALAVNGTYIIIAAEE